MISGVRLGGPIIKNKWFYLRRLRRRARQGRQSFNADSPVTVSLVGRGVRSRAVIDPLEYSIFDAEAAAGCGQSPLPSTCNPLSLNCRCSFFPPNTGLHRRSERSSAINFDFNNINREDNVVFEDGLSSERPEFDFRPALFTRIATKLKKTHADTAAMALYGRARSPQVFGGDWTWTPNSRWVNEARFSYNRFNEHIGPGGPECESADELRAQHWDHRSAAFWISADQSGR